MRHERPVINGDGSYSRDFTYVDNVVEANQKSAVSSQQSAVSSVFNIAYGSNTTLNELFAILRDNLAKYDPEIAGIEPIYGQERAGDIPHSHASIDKAKKHLGYDPQFDARKGFELACDWYYQHLK
jgi:UDP-N-acetylglucosamine 4-epimerase